MSRFSRCAVPVAQALAAALILVPTTLFALDVDLSPEQAARPRADKVPEAIAALPKDFKFVKDGTFTVVSRAGSLPLGTYANDTKTIIGNEPDIAQLVADSLGLKLELVNVAWADWPLGLVSGKYDAVISNVTVTEARKEKFDFSTYRQDVLGFYVKADNDKIKAIAEPKDVAGLKVIVSSGTNQELILLDWIKKNKAAGLPATDVQYYDDPSVRRLAIESGRADVDLEPNAFEAFYAAQHKTTKLVGILNGGWPLSAEIAVTTKKDAGLANAITIALNAQIKNGNYAKVLARWGLTAEAISESRTNPPGLPKT
ncbi:ABC transporter substrate-binding protein [Chelatococcus asaccharovorans]|uniref:Amino acid ABC transporter substrate-binding protein (PAAT family) n=1 Tax=Chelatococcus asaccharovorans TaxID=28210 RepID=A0A2V3U625_9HYPH|nr:ABC transporter substrate-binding protein [Chelatococcus asaccharovorans]MBS7703784.1 ABC transporter substrate-binding protein [Chelatococcus asaccharovorans]PXW57944.1 amino acid ABC transporter substrate-binding protein (PAAT family) [Chelatococcus asaccharovorans]